MKRLRAPKIGCPWDLEQDHKTLKPYLIEEAYEVLDAIDEGDPREIKEELGDLLLQVVFHAQVADDNKHFNIDDVAREIADKMVRRHPHVFGNTKAEDSATVLKNWDEIKKAEKAGKGRSDKHALDGVSKNLPALFENFKISKKVAKLGFDWKKPDDVFKKIAEEIREARSAIKSKNRDRMEDEMGDLLFAAANLCRAYKINPEMALRRANGKFRKRFNRMETFIRAEKLDARKLNFNAWDKLWKRAKKETR